MLTSKVREAYFSSFPYVFWDNFFAEEELHTIETYLRSQPLQHGLVGQSDTGPLLNSDIRKSSVSFINHASENDWIFNRLFVLTDLVNHNFYNLDLIGFDHLQYTLYDTEGSHYGYHMDMQENKSGSEVPRKLSFSLILNDQDEYQGGDLEFFMDDTEQIRAEQRKGRVIAFPSWMVHRVTPVTQGVRRSLVWWACGPKFR